MQTGIVWNIILRAMLLFGVILHATVRNALKLCMNCCIIGSPVYVAMVQKNV